MDPLETRNGEEEAVEHHFPSAQEIEPSTMWFLTKKSEQKLSVMLLVVVVVVVQLEDPFTFQQWSHPRSAEYDDSPSRHEDEDGELGCFHPETWQKSVSTTRLDDEQMENECLHDKSSPRGRGLSAAAVQTEVWRDG